MRGVKLVKLANMKRKNKKKNNTWQSITTDHKIPQLTLKLDQLIDLVSALKCSKTEER